MNYQPILDLLQDGQPRTSYEICEALHGAWDSVKWFRIAGACDRLVEQRRLTMCGKQEHRTVYQMSKGA